MAGHAEPAGHTPAQPLRQKLTPGVDMTTGSLGQGASSAIGLAMAARLDGRYSFVYLATGDIFELGDIATKAASFGWHA